MAIKKYKPTTPGRRGMTVTDYSVLSKVAPERSLLEPARLVEYFSANKKAPSKRSGLDTIRYGRYNENRKRHCDKRLTLLSKRLL